MSTMSLQLHSRRSILTLPTIFKGIFIKLSSGTHFAVWVLSSPSMLMAKRIQAFLKEVVLHSFKKSLLFSPGINLFNWSTLKFTLFIPSLSALIFKPAIREKKHDQSKIDSRFVTLKKTAPPQIKRIGSSKKPDKIYYQVLLNSAVKRYKDFLISLNPLQLVNFYRTNFFKHVKSIPSASLIELYFDGIKKRAQCDRSFCLKLVEQLVNQVIGKSFLSPQAVFFGVNSPLFKPLPPSEALKAVNERLMICELLR